VVKRSLTDQRLIAGDKETRGSTGSIQFYFNGKPAGRPVPVDRFGQARWTSPKLRPGEYKVSAAFLPTKGDEGNLASRSLELIYVVR
jgi:hypothetical protein